MTVNEVDPTIFEIQVQEDCSLNYVTLLHIMSLTYFIDMRKNLFARFGIFVPLAISAVFLVSEWEILLSIPPVDQTSNPVRHVRIIESWHTISYTDDHDWRIDDRLCRAFDTSVVGRSTRLLLRLKILDYHSVRIKDYVIFNDLR